MLFYTVGQSRIFLTMLYAGLAVGLYASLDSAARRLFRPGPVFSLLMDLLFGLISACITCIALVAAADGELRLYSLMGVLSGALIYMGTIGPLLKSAGSLLLRPLNALLGWMKQRSFLKKLLR
ncbi:MAG: spore cortex biosynthesis protein YabQ [Clostridia bacterium]|nr:spore cortex biosynthesis protein YabQ [Clostridia bacterium]